MNIFIDTEFNSFQGELISIGLVSQNGDEFYEVLEIENDYDPWVQEHVVPYLEKKPCSKKDVQHRLTKFLNQYDSIHIISDWPEDIKYFCELLITGPGFAIDYPLISMEINRNINSVQSKVPHNALHDARAILESWYNAYYLDD